MPQLQVVDLSDGQSPLEKTLESFSNRVKENREASVLEDIYSQYQREGSMLDDAIRSVQTRPGLSPTTRVNTINQLLSMQKVNQQLQKQSSGGQEMTPEQRSDRKKRLVEEGFTDNEAEEYLNATPGVQQIIYRKHSDLQDRLKGNSIVSPGGNQQVSSNPPVSGQMAVNASLGVEESPVIQQESQKEWPDIPLPPGRTAAELVKWENQNQKENNKILADTREKTTANRGIGIRLGRMGSLVDKLPQGVGRVIINPETGEPYGVAQVAGLVNKETQDYVKTLNDFLIDAKAYFGNRVTNFDVQSFKSRLPTLLNTDEGQRVIIKQMQLMNDLQNVHDVTLEDALKHYGRKAPYSDILNIVDDKVKDKEKAIIQKINDLDAASEWMEIMAKNPKEFSNKVLMQDPNGKFKALPKENVNRAVKRGWSVY